jgi:hypothetical protein
MLEPRRRPTSGQTGRPGARTTGRAAARKQRGLLHRTGIVLPAAAIASATVSVVTIASYLFSANGSGADSLAQAINALPKSKSIGLLEQERQQIIVMNQAASTMAVAAKPAVVSPSDISAAGGGTSGQGSSTSGQGSSTSSAPVVAPDPGSAQHIAYQMMSSFGFSPSSEWTCLDEVWTKESSWQYDAENPSGAYGIPQSLPASKMAAAGSDYRTNPATQIKWGLGYIQSTYGTPCGAWSHEVNYGWY